MTKRIVFAIAILILPAATLFLTSGDGRAFSRLSDPSAPTIEKTDRLPAASQYGYLAVPEEDGEWILDCYDQFGPDARQPDARGLKSCLSS